MRSYAAISAAVLTVSLVAVVLTSETAAQQKLTPGTAALLVTQTTPDSKETLRQALADSDVDVRRVAARVVGVLERALVPALLEQLARESDERAAAEQLRAVLFIRGVDALPEATAAATRLGGRTRLALAEWLARKDPDRFATALRDLAQGLSDRELSDLAGITAMAIQQHTSIRQRVTEIWVGMSTGAAWRKFLDTPSRRRPVAS